MIRLAIFDLDRTLTVRPTYSAFLLSTCVRLAPWRLMLLPTLLPVAAAYGIGRLDRRIMKQAMHWVALGRAIPRHRIEAAAERFARHLVRKGVFAQVPALLQERRADGRRIVLATAAPALYAEPFARIMGFDDVIATQGTWSEERLLTSIMDENCYGNAKAARLVRWLQEQGIARAEADIEFYSDHHSDLPTFEWANAAIAVNPSRRLRHEAEVRGWTILDWRGART